MKDNRDCAIVRDLLPLYIEGTCSEQTRQFVEEHLKTCDECCLEYEHLQNYRQSIPKKDSSYKEDPEEIAAGNAKNVAVAILLTLVLCFIVPFALYVPTRAVPWTSGLLDVTREDDEDFEIAIHLKNYKNAYAAYRTNSNGTYDVYVTVEQNLLSRIASDPHAGRHAIEINRRVCASMKTGTGEICFYPPDDCEVSNIYYIPEKFVNIAGLDSVLFEGADVNAHLVWSAQ